MATNPLDDEIHYYSEVLGVPQAQLAKMIVDNENKKQKVKSLLSAPAPTSVETFEEPNLLKRILGGAGNVAKKTGSVIGSGAKAVGGAVAGAGRELVDDVKGIDPLLGLALVDYAFGDNSTLNMWNANQQADKNRESQQAYNLLMKEMDDAVNTREQTIENNKATKEKVNEFTKLVGTAKDEKSKTGKNEDITETTLAQLKIAFDDMPETEKEKYKDIYGSFEKDAQNAPKEITGGKTTDAMINDAKNEKAALEIAYNKLPKKWTTNSDLEWQALSDKYDDFNSKITSSNLGGHVGALSFDMTKKPKKVVVKSKEQKIQDEATKLYTDVKNGLIKKSRAISELIRWANNNGITLDKEAKLYFPQ